MNNKSLDKLRATLAMVDQIDKHQVIVRSTGTSGIMRKAEGKFIAG